jgi:hypothetical protein
VNASAGGAGAAAATPAPNVTAAPASTAVPATATARSDTPGAREGPFRQLNLNIPPASPNLDNAQCDDRRVYDRKARDKRERMIVIYRIRCFLPPLTSRFPIAQIWRLDISFRTLSMPIPAAPDRMALTAYGSFS